MNKKHSLKLVLAFSVIGLILSFFAIKTFAISYNVSVFGAVAPTTKDYAISITSDKAGQTIPQGTVITYTITYGGANGSAYTTDTTITANYNDDTPDSITHVTEYIVGSATNAVNDTTPVIDPVNRTITWNINEFNSVLTNRTVQFQLITNDTYTLPNPVQINTTAELGNAYVTMPLQTTTSTYLFDVNITPTPTITPTPLPTATPTPGPTSIPPTSTPGPTTPKPTPITTITPTQTPTSPPPAKGILTVDVTNLQPTLAQLLIQTTKTDSLIINYGTTLTHLDKTMSFPAHGIDTPTLTPLTPATTYYLQISALDKNGHVINRDTFVIHTPALGSVPVVNLSSLILNADGITINKNDFTLSGTNAPLTYLLPTNNDYSIFFAFSSAQNLSQVTATLRPENLSTQLTSSYLDQTKMYERSPDSYVSSMTSPSTTGIYDLFIKSTTTTGIIEEQKIAMLHVLGPLHIYDTDEISPLSDARVYIKFYDFTRQAYMPLQMLYSQIKNPLFTRSDGTVYFPFPAGKYKLTISAFGHEEKTISFPIGLNDNQQFPQISLRADYWNLGYFIRFLKETSSDFFTTLSTEFYLIGSRQSYFILLAIVLIPITLSFLAFFAKTHMNPKTLFHFLRRHVVTNNVYRFYVISEQRKPVNEAEVYIVNKSDIVVLTTKTNNLGICFARIPELKNLSLRVIKQGFEPFSQQLEQLLQQNQTITITLTQQPSHTTTPVSLTIYLLKELLGTTFELMLLLSFIAEILFAFQFGLLATSPFLILSLINAIFWISYLQESLKKRE